MRKGFHKNKEVRKFLKKYGGPQAGHTFWTLVDSDDPVHNSQAFELARILYPNLIGWLIRKKEIFNKSFLELSVAERTFLILVTS